MTNWGKVHETKPDPDAVWAWGVYADYDGNAPDSEYLVLCASPQLADAVVKLFNEAEDTDGGFVTGPDGEPVELSMPFIDGWEWCKTYAVRGTTSNRQHVRFTLADCLKVIS